MRARADEYDEMTTAEAMGLLGGVGVLSMQAAAMIPGLLPIGLLLLPLLLPLVVLGVVVGVVVGLPYGLWRLLRRALRPFARRRETAAHDSRWSLRDGVTS